MTISSENAKRNAIKKLLVSSCLRLEQCDIAGVHKTIAHVIEIAKTIPRRMNDQDLTVEANLALESLRQILLLKSKVLDHLEIAKVNFRVEK